MLKLLKTTLEIGTWNFYFNYKHCPSIGQRIQTTEWIIIKSHLSCCPGGDTAPVVPSDGEGEFLECVMSTLGNTLLKPRQSIPALV